MRSKWLVVLLVASFLLAACAAPSTPVAPAEEVAQAPTEAPTVAPEPTAVPTTAPEPNGGTDRGRGRANSHA